MIWSGVDPIILYYFTDGLSIWRYPFIIIYLNIIETVDLISSKNILGKFHGKTRPCFQTMELLVLLKWAFKNDEKCFLSYLKSSIRSQENQIFVLTFSPCRNTTWLERSGQIQNSWRHNLVNNQLQLLYWPISQAVKAMRQWNLVT